MHIYYFKFVYDNISNSDLVLFPCNLLSLTQKIDNCQVDFEMNSSRIPIGRSSCRKSWFSSISEDTFLFLYVFFMFISIQMKNILQMRLISFLHDKFQLIELEYFSDAGRWKKLWVPVVKSRQNLSPLVGIGLTDLPNIGCAMAHPAHPGTTGLRPTISLT